MKIIYLDFDGTVVEHAYPLIGAPNPFALRIINKLQQKGYNIVLNTMRVMFNDDSLEKALEYLNINLKSQNSIQHHTLNKLNPPAWRKEKLKNADEIFIDDVAQGIPLIPTENHGYMVNWLEVEKHLIEAGILDE